MLRAVLVHLTGDVWNSEGFTGGPVSACSLWMPMRMLMQMNAFISSTHGSDHEAEFAAHKFVQNTELLKSTLQQVAEMN